MPAYNEADRLGDTLDALIHLELGDGTGRSVDIVVGNTATAQMSLGRPIVFRATEEVWYQASAADIDVQVTGLEV